MKVLLLLCTLFSMNAFAKEYEMKMKSMSYDPKTLTIAVGDSVKWTNGTYTKHTATGKDWDTGMVKPQTESKPIVFNKPGKYDFHCLVHGSAMKGTITVGAK
ncbi:MAG: cupredoxin domain-containing protein [Rhizobacter sp.]|nr:cupredoxin domain-containing protein [Bacteriovorax sp.]